MSDLRDLLTTGRPLLWAQNHHFWIDCYTFFCSMLKGKPSETTHVTDSLNMCLIGLQFCSKRLYGSKKLRCLTVRSLSNPVRVEIVTFLYGLLCNIITHWILTVLFDLTYIALAVFLYYRGKCVISAIRTIHVCAIMFIVICKQAGAISDAEYLGFWNDSDL